MADRRRLSRRSVLVSGAAVALALVVGVADAKPRGKSGYPDLYSDNY